MLSGPVLAASLISLFSVGVALYVAAVLQGLSCLAFIVLAKNPCLHPRRSVVKAGSAKRKGVYCHLPCEIRVSYRLNFLGHQFYHVPLLFGDGTILDKY